MIILDIYFEDNIMYAFRGQCSTHLANIVQDTNFEHKPGIHFEDHFSYDYEFCKCNEGSVNIVKVVLTKYFWSNAKSTYILHVYWYIYIYIERERERADNYKFCGNNTRYILRKCDFGWSDAR